MRLEFVGNLIIFFAALFTILSKDSISPGLAGLSISYAMQVRFYQGVFSIVYCGFSHIYIVGYCCCFCVGSNSAVAVVLGLGVALSPRDVGTWGQVPPPPSRFCLKQEVPFLFSGIAPLA